MQSKSLRGVSAGPPPSPPGSNQVCCRVLGSVMREPIPARSPVAEWQEAQLF